MTNPNIPIVQGVAVPSGGYVTLPNASNQYEQQQNSPYQTQADFNGVKGESQPKQFQDVFWAVLFGAHLLVMVVLMAIMSTSLQNSGYNYSGVVWCVSMCALVALGLSTLALGFMMQFATEMVKMALFFSIGCSLAMGIIGAMMGQIWMAIIGFISFAIGCCYAYFMWGRIPVRSSSCTRYLAS
jgi:cation transport ATPase